jgi:hypothetical protein
MSEEIAEHINQKWERKRRSETFYGAFVSAKATLFFLGIFAILFALGAVFPQSDVPDRFDRYREAGGKFAALAEWLDLLNLFHSWRFLTLAALFALHLLLCIVHRLNIIRKRPKYGLFTKNDLLLREHVLSLSCSDGQTGRDIERTLKRIGLRRIRYYSENVQVKRLVVEKGFPIRWLSLAYHLFLLVALVGFAVSSLSAFGSVFALAEGERKPIPPASPKTPWTTITGAFGINEESGQKRLEIELTDFFITYRESPRLQYPASVSARFLSLWKGATSRPRYILPKGSLTPGDWHSALNVYREGEAAMRKTIDVGNPLRLAGITLHQIGYQHSFDLRPGEETLSNLRAEEPFIIPQMEGQFLLETPRGGTVRKYGGGFEEAPLSAKLKYRPPASSTSRSWKVVAELSPGQTVNVMHTPMTLSNVTESSILMYHSDPGAPLLLAVALSVIILMALRIYLPWYQVHCFAERMNDGALVTISIRMVGLLARPERLKQRINEALRR